MMKVNVCMDAVVLTEADRNSELARKAFEANELMFVEDAGWSDAAWADIIDKAAALGLQVDPKSLEYDMKHGKIFLDARKVGKPAGCPDPKLDDVYAKLVEVNESPYDVVYSMGGWPWSIYAEAIDKKGERSEEVADMAIDALDRFVDWAWERLRCEYWELTSFDRVFEALVSAPMPVDPETGQVVRGYIVHYESAAEDKGLEDEL